MKHRLIVESTIKNFNKEITTFLDKGYHQIPGSVYTKSVETETPTQSIESNMDDVGDIYTISLEKENGNNTVVVSGDIDDFFNTVENLLYEGHKVVIGSIYINSTKEDGYAAMPRCYVTWYCCIMGKG